MFEENKNNGVIIVNKESGITSYDVIRKLKKILGTSKIGHTGTLDPLAEGVMVICVEKTTKLAEKIEAQSKTYIAEMILGYSTNTYDTEGEITERSDFPVPDRDAISDVMKKYVGETYQIPPMYSALKHEGKKLYELARDGIEIEREKRKINIEYINLLSVNEDRVIFEAKVSKGTYIRSLINDIGIDLKTFACMSGLKRTAVGNFHIKDSYSLAQLETMAKEDDYSFFIRVEKLFEWAPIFNINNEKDVKLFKNGNTVVINEKDKSGAVRVYHQNEFLGIGKISGKLLKGDKYF